MMLWPLTVVAGIALIPAWYVLDDPFMRLQKPHFLVIYIIGTSIFLICLPVLISWFRSEYFEKSRASKRVSRQEPEKHTHNQSETSSVPTTIKLKEYR